MNRSVMRRALVTTLLACTAAALALPLGAGAAVTRPHDVLPASSHARIRFDASVVTLGDRVVATIVVTPRSAGRVVLLQRQGASRWRNVARGRTNRRGSVTLSAALSPVGNFKLRALIPASTTAVEAVSPSDEIQIIPPYAGTQLSPGDTGPQVVALQDRLTQLGYWLGASGGYYGDATTQAVYALQKAAGLSPDGVVGAQTASALEAGVRPQPRSLSGTHIEISLRRDLIMFVIDGQLAWTLNTSTGGGYTYTQDGATDVATTPTGDFHMYRAVDGFVKDSLGLLWRPRFFYEGFAIHGDTYVPPVPVSHGCARVSNEAIDWIWSQNLAPMGIEVSVY